ncbi:MAG: hypothetical protein ACI4GB_06270 [Acutalibacteraceae bacterium]
MTEKELWEVFMKTGRISDYLSYRRARDQARYDSDGLSELSEEFYEEDPEGKDWQ